jgi:hypothetical protein
MELEADGYEEAGCFHFSHLVPLCLSEVNYSAFSSADIGLSAEKQTAK